MKQVLIDTNFILTCIKQKIDFFEDLKLKGFEILIPKQIIRELKGIKQLNAKLALKILEKNKFKEIDIGKGVVDKKIIKYLKDKKNILIATLDKDLKEKLKNSKIIIKEKKRLSIQ